MEFELPPELTESDREALLAGLEQLLARSDESILPPANRSAWLAAALRENAGDSGDGAPA